MILLERWPQRVGRELDRACEFEERPLWPTSFVTPQTLTICVKVSEERTRLPIGHHRTPNTPRGAARTRSGDGRATRLEL
jgi:hypothetical protein